MEKEDLQKSRMRNKGNRKHGEPAYKTRLGGTVNGMKGGRLGSEQIHRKYIAAEILAPCQNMLECEK